MAFVTSLASPAMVSSPIQTHKESASELVLFHFMVTILRTLVSEHARLNNMGQTRHNCAKIALRLVPNVKTLPRVLLAKVAPPLLSIKCVTKTVILLINFTGTTLVSRRAPMELS